MGRGLAGAKQNAVGAWVFGKHACQRGGGRGPAAGVRFQLTRWPFALEAASRIPARMRLKGTPAGMPELGEETGLTCSGSSVVGIAAKPSGSFALIVARHEAPSPFPRE